MISEEEQRLLDEINFWIEYIQSRCQNSSDPVPQTAIDSLDKVVEQLIDFYKNRNISDDDDEKNYH